MAEKKELLAYFFRKTIRIYWFNAYFLLIIYLKSLLNETLRIIIMLFEKPGTEFLLQEGITGIQK
jgi:hypothetical protein